VNEIGRDDTGRIQRIDRDFSQGTADTCADRAAHEKTSLMVVSGAGKNEGGTILSDFPAARWLEI
jgi:hypothetical protein